MDSLQLQLQASWHRPPMLHPDMAIKFTVSNPALDKDGMLATILDLLQPKGSNTIFNDNIAKFNGRTTIEPADICAPGGEMVEIWLYPTHTEGSNEHSG